MDNAYPYEYLRFDSDWNWIIEVVEAIEKIEIQEAQKQELPNNQLNKQLGRVLDRVLDLPIYTKKEAVVHAINQFLIWYEQQINQ